MFAAEVISLIQQIPSVKFVMDVEILARPVVPVEEKSLFEETIQVPLTPVDKMLKVPVDGLLCSLDHQIDILGIQEPKEEEQGK